MTGQDDTRSDDAAGQDEPTTAIRWEDAYRSPSGRSAPPRRDRADRTPSDGPGPTPPDGLPSTPPDGVASAQQASGRPADGSPAWGTPDSEPTGPGAPWRSRPAARGGKDDGYWSMTPDTPEQRARVWPPPDPGDVQEAVAAMDLQPSAPTPSAVGTGFCLLVEQNTGGGTDFRWVVQPEPTKVFATRDEARDYALGLCRGLSPEHPFSEQERQIYRLSPDAYLVTVRGAMKSFHFRISVAERVR